MAGKAALLAGNVPEAVFFCRKGLELDPDDQCLRQTLQIARSRAAFASPEDRAALTPRPEPVESLRRPLRQWGLLVIAASNLLAWTALGWWIVTRRPRWLTVFVLCLALALLATVGWLLDRHNRQVHSGVFAVLKRAETLRRGDSLAFLPRRDSPLPPGVEVRILTERGQWTQVELADGTVGWLAPGYLLRFDSPWEG
jgi:hypothetical protein